MMFEYFFEYFFKIEFNECSLQSGNIIRYSEYYKILWLSQGILILYYMT